MKILLALIISFLFALESNAQDLLFNVNGKPQSDTLYFKCGNEIEFTSIEQGQYTYRATGARAIRGARFNYVTIVPNSSEVTLYISKNETPVGKKQKFQTIKSPKPTIQILFDDNSVIAKNGASLNNSIKLKAVADEKFKAVYPKDARYKVTKWNLKLLKNGNVIFSSEFYKGLASTDDFKDKVNMASRIVIEVLEVKRLNFMSKVEDIEMGTQLFNIPLIK